jgi:hypothetical protein
VRRVTIPSGPQGQDLAKRLPGGDQPVEEPVRRRTQRPDAVRAGQADGVQENAAYAAEESAMCASCGPHHLMEPATIPLMMDF